MSELTKLSLILLSRMDILDIMDECEMAGHYNSIINKTWGRWVE